MCGLGAGFACWDGEVVNGEIGMGVECFLLDGNDKIVLRLGELVGRTSTGNCGMLKFPLLASYLQIFYGNEAFF